MPAVPLASASVAIRLHARGGVGRRAGVAREDAERQHLQRVAGQDGGGLVERAMTGRPAAAQVVVVHRRQVVVHQRVGVDQLDGAGRAHRRARAARRASRRWHRRGRGGCACRGRARCSAAPRAVAAGPPCRAAATHRVRARRAAASRSRRSSSGTGHRAARVRGRAYSSASKGSGSASGVFGEQDLDALLGLLQRRLAAARELDATLEVLERFLERQSPCSSVSTTASSSPSACSKSTVLACVVVTMASGDRQALHTARKQGQRSLCGRKPSTAQYRTPRIPRCSTEAASVDWLRDPALHCGSVRHSLNQSLPAAARRRPWRFP